MATCRCALGVSRYKKVASRPDSRCMNGPLRIDPRPQVWWVRVTLATLGPVPTAFLLVSLWGVLFTVNAYRPVRENRVLLVPSFFAAWLTGELPLHHLAWQVLATAAFVRAGALSSW